MPTCTEARGRRRRAGERRGRGGAQRAGPRRNFLLDRHDRVGADARRSEAPRVLYLGALARLTSTARRGARGARAVRREGAPIRAGPPRVRRHRGALVGRPEDGTQGARRPRPPADRRQVLYVLGTIAESRGELRRGARAKYEPALCARPGAPPTRSSASRYEHDLAGEDDAAIELYRPLRGASSRRA